jgi:hypothetical protein
MLASNSLSSFVVFSISPFDCNDIFTDSITGWRCHKTNDIRSELCTTITLNTASNTYAVCVVELVVCGGLATNTSPAEWLSNIRKVH